MGIVESNDLHKLGYGAPTTMIRTNQLISGTAPQKITDDFVKLPSGVIKHGWEIIYKCRFLAWQVILVDFCKAILAGS